MALPNVFSDSPLSPLGIRSPIEDVIGRVNWLIADFNERRKEDAAPESAELAATVPPETGAANKQMAKSLCISCAQECPLRMIQGGIVFVVSQCESCIGA
jgi:hypothetical protein